MQRSSFRFLDHRYLLVVAIGATAACARTQTDTAAVPSSATSAAAPESEATPFENPGGMWMPGQMGDHADTLKSLGLAYDPGALTDPTAFPLGAVVSLGGCSASFVSEEGLIVTNHHCVGGHLQYNSTPEANLLEDGYLAKTRADEKWGGPTARVYVTKAFTDVTDHVLGGTETIADPKARYEAIEARAKDLTAKCEQGKPDTRCRVASYFEGAQFFQIEQLQIRDVRLVYAPDAGIGVFGGEIDNWRWPRHTGDWSFLRAYVGKDGKPADYSPDNVPFRPPHHLKVATEALTPGDFVMVAGYPGRTYRHKTADEVRDAATWGYPRRIALFEQTLDVLARVTEGREDLKIKAASRSRGLANYLTNFKGMLEGLTKGGLAEQKASLEADLKAWIAADPTRQREYGGVLEEMERIRAEARKTRDRDAALGEILRGSSLLGQAFTIVTMAEERDKPDADRKAGYQERDWDRREQGSRRMQRTYDPVLDRALFEMYLQRAAALPAAQRPAEALRAVTGSASPDRAAIAKALDRFYGKTRLGDEDRRVDLLKTATSKTIERSKDPFISLAVRLGSARDELNARSEKEEGALARLRPKYMAALRAHAVDPLAPDANGTLRVTYGTVRGYRPRPDAALYTPFTTMTELVGKHTGEEPFDAPDAQIAAAKGKDFGPYADARLGDLPVNFLADLDITGGNSGSATLNARGELVGLVFDGNYEAMASDWIFMPDITRSIHVDSRYMLWTMDAVDGADHLLTEMGITPAISSAP